MTLHPGRVIVENVRIGFLTDPGVVRAENQDALFIPDPSQVDTRKKGVLVAVADGMGGCAGGSLASCTAVECLSRYYEEPGMENMLDLGVMFRVEAAHFRLQELAKERPQLKGMGTTLTAVLVVNGSLEFFHVGDSRAYLLRQGCLEQVTDDHTLVARWARAGTLSNNRRGIGKNVLTRALGVGLRLEVDRRSRSLAGGDRILLASDGLHCVAEGAELTEILGRKQPPWEASRQLVELARDKGGPDNITAVVIDVTASPE